MVFFLAEPVQPGVYSIQNTDADGALQLLTGDGQAKCSETVRWFSCLWMFSILQICPNTMSSLYLPFVFAKFENYIV